jgi:CspA family cold shock protein
MMGTIRTLRADKGFGFIKGEAGQEYFFHQSAIYGEGIADLREGDGVEFEVEDSPKGPAATRDCARRTCGSLKQGERPTGTHTQAVCL